MIRTSPATIRRAAAVVLAAAVLSIYNHQASAQTLDLFSGALSATNTPPTSLSVSSTLSVGTISNTGSFGPTGYSGTVQLGGGAVNTLSEGFVANGASNAFFISQTGLAALGGSTTATKTFGPSLAPNTTYALTLTRSNAATAGLLGSLGITLSNNGTIFLNTATGVGLVGTVDVLGLFGNTGTTSTFTFTTPANYVAAGTLGVTINGNLPVNAAGGSYVFTSGAITQVPEPHTTAAMLLGAGGLIALRFRRRLRSA